MRQLPQSETARHRRRMSLAAIGMAGLAAVGITKGVDYLTSDHGPKAINLDAPHNEYVVQPGDTLDSIANQAEPNGDPNNLVDSIELTIAAREQLDKIEDAVNIVPGEIIPLPYGAKIGDVVGADADTISIPGTK